MKVRKHANINHVTICRGKYKLLQNTDNGYILHVLSTFITCMCGIVEKSGSPVCVKSFYFGLAAFFVVDR